MPTKISFNLSDRAELALESMCKSEGISKTESINRALILFNDLLIAERAGSKIILRTSDQLDTAVRFF